MYTYSKAAFLRCDVNTLLPHLLPSITLHTARSTTGYTNTIFANKLYMSIQYYKLLIYYTERKIVSIFK